MPNCPYCLEEIKDGARKCPHCQTSFEASETSANVVYILDQGLVRFGKFIGAALGFFLLIGVYLFGIDLKDTVKKTSEAELQVKKGALAFEEQKTALDAKAKSINEAIARIEALEKEVVRHRDETQGNAAAVRELMAEIQRQKDFAVQAVVDIRSLSLSSAEQAVASTKREERGISSNRGKLWKVGSNLRFAFLDGGDEQKALVRSAISKWVEHVNLGISESGLDRAELRISFKATGNWSYLGTDALGKPKTEPTINYQSLNDLSDKAFAMQAALHEFGHALGLTHEFLNPSAGNLFDRKAIRAYNKTTLLFSDEALENIFFKKDNYPGQRPYDPLSIMSYSLPANVFLNPKNECRPGSDLSESDKSYVSSLYPKT